MCKRVKWKNSWNNKKMSVEKLKNYLKFETSLAYKVVSVICELLEIWESYIVFFGGEGKVINNEIKKLLNSFKSESIMIRQHKQFN